MRKRVALFFCVALLACTPTKPKTGDAYIGSWVNEKDTSVANVGNFVIKDRILIAKTASGYEAMLFRQGGGAIPMLFDVDTGYLCNTQKSCLSLKDERTIELKRGNESIFYKKEEN